MPYATQCGLVAAIRRCDMWVGNFSWINQEKFPYLLFMSLPLGMPGAQHTASLRLFRTLTEAIQQN